jgi:nitrite reductase/ring-hydroxylating ferredoxin subunit
MLPRKETAMKVRLADEAAVTEGALTEVDFFGRPAVLLLEGGRVKAYLNVCAHLGGPVWLEGDRLECAWHGACFEAATGKATRGPAAPDSRLIRLPVRVEGGGVFYVYGE